MLKSINAFQKTEGLQRIPAAGPATLFHFNIYLN